MVLRTSDFQMLQSILSLLRCKQHVLIYRPNGESVLPFIPKVSIFNDLYSHSHKTIKQAVHLFYEQTVLTDIHVKSFL